MELISYTEALNRCQPGGEEDGYCIGCKAYAPVISFGEHNGLCPACAYPFAAAHPHIARALQSRPEPPRSTDMELPF